MTSISRCERVTLWLYRLAQHAASGESVAEFCGREGISTVSFYQWKRRLSPQAAKECEGGASAVNSVYESKEIPGFTQLIVNRSATGRSANAMSEPDDGSQVFLPGGITIALGNQPEVISLIVGQLLGHCQSSQAPAVAGVARRC